MNETLRAALEPRSIAVIGASENVDKVGGRPVDYLRRFGFRGRLYPVNPARPEVQGLRAWPGFDALPECPELVIVAVPGEAAVEAVEQCAARGVKVAIVMSSGFGETSDPQGQARQRRMAQAARAAGMRLVGPNSQGLANFGTGVVASFSTMFKEVEPADGAVAMLSQSGALSVVPYGLLRRRGIGVRHAHATGNDADVTVAELAAAVAEDEAVRLLLLYLEGIPDPHNLEEVARVARTRRLPVLALKSGRTAAGAAAARSHTGALASEDRVVDAFFESVGIWRVRTVDELVDSAELYLKGGRPGGRRLVSISNSGATCVLSADAASMAGLSLARLAPATHAVLEKTLPSFATLTNPIDVTGALLSDSSLFGRTLAALTGDPGVDAFFVGIPVAGAGYDVEAFADASARLERDSGKPVIAAAPQPEVAARFAAHGVPVWPTESRAIAALAQWIAHHERIDRAIGRHREGRARCGGVEAAPTGEAGAPAPRMLNEADSLALLARAGVPVVEHWLCRSPEEARAALARAGGPVALKACSAEVAHKSELGLVELGVTGAAQVDAAWARMRETLAARGLAFDGMIVAQMCRGRREMMIGAHRDPAFGPVVVVGDGGTYVEALGDVALLLPPFEPDDVREKLTALRIAPLLAGVRGEPPMDVDALAAAACAVGALVGAAGSPIASLDLNPVMLGSRGEGCRAVDAVVFVRG